MRHVIIMPDLGQTSSEAKIVSWLKAPGDKLAMGDPLLEVETDKATMDVEAYVGGFLRRRLAEVGAIVAASTPVAILTDSSDEELEEEAAVALNARVSAPVPLPDASLSAGRPSVSGPVSAVPAARMLAKQLGVDLSDVCGTGTQGMITKADVEQFVARRDSRQVAENVPARETKAQEAMAALTSRSKSTIPHFYVTVDLDMTCAERWRVRWNEEHPELAASVNDCLVRAASAALAESPRINVAVRDGKAEPQSAAHVTIVVGVDGALLLVPVPDPHADSVEGFLRQMRAAIGSAQKGKIPVVPFMPSLAISNLGMFGVKEFSAIIPPGCAAVLAVGALRQQVVWREERAQPLSVCTATVSADHRVVDGIAVAQFLERMQFHLNSL